MKHHPALTILLLFMAVLVALGSIGDDLSALREHAFLKPPRTLAWSNEQLVPKTAGGMHPVVPDANPAGRALTVRDVFGRSARQVSAKGATLKLVGARDDLDCAAAIWGARLREALRRARCNRAVGGLYHGNGNQLVQLSIFHVQDKATLPQLSRLLPDDRAHGFVRTLRMPKRTGRLGATDNDAFSHVMGDNIVIVWSQTTDASEHVDLQLAVDMVFDRAYDADDN